MHVIDLSTFDAGPPVVHELPQQVHVVLGEEFQITCTATNDQDAPRNLMFSWRVPRRVAFHETTTDEDDSRTASSTIHISNVTNNLPVSIVNLDSPEAFQKSATDFLNK